MRLAVLKGAPVELLRVRMMTADGSVWVAIRIAERYSGAAFLRQIADAGDRAASLLERYADRDRTLFEIPVAVEMDDGGRWRWAADPVVQPEIMEQSGGRVVGVAGRLADEILPIVVAAINAGEFP